MIRVIVPILSVGFLGAIVTEGSSQGPFAPLPATDAQRQSEIDFCDIGDQGRQVLFKPIQQIEAVISSDAGRLPPDCSTELFQPAGSDASRRLPGMAFHWQPTNLFHHPLYFDDMPLERHGQTVHPHLQPSLSGLKFFLTIPVLPYKIGVDRPWKCVTKMGNAPPGSCVPCVKETLPVQWDAALFETAAALALVFTLP